MPKYAATVSLKRKGERHPPGTVFTDLSKDEVKFLKAAKAIEFVVPGEDADDDAPPKVDAGKGAKGPPATPAPTA